PTALRRSFPRAKIGWAIDAELMPAIAGHRDVDYIHSCPRSGWLKAASNPLNWPRIGRDLYDFAGTIETVGYDVAIDAQGLLMSALLPFMAHIQRRVGFAHRREMSQLFYTEKYISKSQYFDPHYPHFQHMLALVGAIGGDTSGHEIILPPTGPHVRATLDMMLDRAFASRDPLIALAPGATWPSKQWPAKYWFELLEMILLRTSANVVLIGSQSEARLAAELSQRDGESGRWRILNLAGKTTLPELYALLERVPIVIAAETAPLHAAGAARCAHLVGIYGPTPGARAGPQGSPDTKLLSARPSLPCQPCQQRRCRYGTNQCMRNVAPAAVFAAVTQALASLENGHP
ncbi:MAG TPA: glycosyltransferase family 9 protein, partial [Candidatus Binataceae bacterium]